MNNYGNYVVQKALKLSSKDDKTTLIKNIFKNMNKIKDKKLNAKWKSILESNLEGTFESFDDRSNYDKRERKDFKSKTTKEQGPVLPNQGAQYKPNLYVNNNVNVNEFGYSGRTNTKNTTQKYNNKNDFENKVYNRR